MCDCAVSSVLVVGAVVFVLWCFDVSVSVCFDIRSVVFFFFFLLFVFFQAEDGIRDLVRSRGLGDVYKRQV
mgnify:CR=1 FL=1